MQKTRIRLPAWWKVAIVLALVATVVVVIVLRQQSVAPSTSLGSPSVSSTTTGLPRLLELGSVNCIPCQRMQPILAELRQEYPDQLQVDFIDVWEVPEEAERYRIQLIPTQIFFDEKGQEFSRHEGFFPKDQVLETFRQHGLLLEGT